MAHEIKVVDELEIFFKAQGLETKRSEYRYYHEERIIIDGYHYVEIDLVIKRDGIEIPIEVKASFDTDSIHKGIGQALSYLIFYEESWLAVPPRAIDLLKQILQQVRLDRFKVFDWQNKILYEYHNGKIVVNEL